MAHFINGNIWDAYKKKDRTIPHIPCANIFYIKDTFNLLYGFEEYVYDAPSTREFNHIEIKPNQTLYIYYHDPYMRADKKYKVNLKLEIYLFLHRNVEIVKQNMLHLSYDNFKGVKDKIIRSCSVRFSIPPYCAK
jgi:hypothetical protein